MFYDNIGLMIIKYTQQSGKEFRCLCCPNVQLRDLEPYLRVDLRKRAAIAFCDIATLNLCCSYSRCTRYEDYEGYVRISERKSSKTKSVSSSGFFEPNIY